jgi:intraflagellar transport protein 122
VKFETTDNTLTVGCWSVGLAQYKITGNGTFSSAGNEKPLKGHDPTSMSFYSSGEVFALGGTDGSVNLYTKDAIYIGPVCKHTEWVWGVSCKSNQNIVVSGTNKGVLRANQVVLSVIHALYKDRYAYRDQLTDVIIQHLVTDNRVRIRCRDFIKRMALYKERLAVQLTDKIIIYSVNPDDPYDMRYKALKKINYKYFSYCLM